MSTQAPPRPSTDVRRRRTLLAGAAIAAVIVIVAVAFAVLGGGDDDTGGERGARVLSLEELATTAAGFDRPVFWLGAQPGSEYELTRLQDGRVYVRYVPAGTQPGTESAKFVSVGSYPQQQAFETLLATAKRQDADTIRLPDGGRAFQDANRPTSAYAAYPGVDVQIEAFDPAPGRALAAIEAGRLTRVARPASRIASLAQLRRLDTELGHPVYWAGARPGSRYELTRTTDGRVYLRYLDAGAPAGDESARYLTVGTYPQEDALATLRETAATANAQTIALAGGAVGYVDPRRPTSAYLAFPDEDVQVEIYTPDAARTAELLSAGRVAPIG